MTIVISIKWEKIPENIFHDMHKQLVQRPRWRNSFSKWPFDGTDTARRVDIFYLLALPLLNLV